jgi:autotransporter-associated beta strand protein
LPTTGNITTTTVNSSFPQGQQTILGGYATVNGTTWAVSGSGATAGIITGLTNYDTNFDGNTDVDVTSVTPTSVSTNYINSLRFNIAAPYTLTLGSPVSFSANMSAVSLYIASGGILETSNVGANADSITSGVLSTSNGTDLIVIQNNVAAPLTISSQIVNFNTSGVNLGLTKAGPGTLIISGANTYTGTTIVNGGTLALGAIGALPSGNNLTVDGGASLVETNLGTTTSMYVGKLVDDGKIDLANNGLVVHSGTLAAVTALVAGGYNNGGWNGSTGIVSSAASSDTTYLTAVGVIVNDNGSGTALYGSGGTLNSTFNGITPVDGDILVKYTYYGDTNLDGAVDGSDYTNIDNGFHNQLTGWINGDFNYDGVVDGSDYTLIDNAYNMQGPSLGSNPASLIASNTAQIAGASAVPEPTAMSLISAAATGLLTRRRRQR